MVIPYTVIRYFTNSPEVRQLYFSADEPSIVIPGTGEIRKVIHSRHRPESAYFVHNHAEVVAMAERTANVLSAPARRARRSLRFLNQLDLLLRNSQRAFLGGRLDCVQRNCKTTEGNPLVQAITFSLLLLVLFVSVPTWSQDHHSPHEHAHMSMSTGEPTQAELLSWKRESEGNHHLIGFLVVLGGVFILAEDILKKRFPAVSYAWPISFLISGLFVLACSDTELWPFGPKPWIQGTMTNPEVIQHKIFAVLLLGLGLVEMQRARDRLKAAAWVFPLFAVAGSVLLLFHSHNAGMRGENHMAIMARIHAEHLSYAAIGFGIGLTKGLAEVRTKWQTIFANLWPTLMIVLGVLLVFYTESP